MPLMVETAESRTPSPQTVVRLLRDRGALAVKLVAGAALLEQVGR